jgi:hypothetical protein
MKVDWEYNPIRDERETYLMSIKEGDNPRGWWTLIYTNDEVLKCVDVKHNEIANNNWGKVILIGKMKWNCLHANEHRIMSTNPYKPPYSIWGLNKPFTSQKVIEYDNS